jgi:hypothetical protein
LEAALDRFSANIEAGNKALSSEVVFGAELLPANCNRGEGLLQPGVMASVRLYLDRLQEVGVRGVTIPIHYPIYTPAFPRYQDYRAFFKQVANEVHKRGLTLDVEAHALFANTPFSPVKWDFSGLTVDTYRKDKLAMDQQILDDLHPEILNLGAEPGTEATLLSNPSLNDPAAYAEYIGYLTAGLNRGSTTLIAGIGSWQSPEYVRRLVSLPLDGIVIHVYPVVGNALSNMVQIADLASKAGKGLYLDECWLYKTDVVGEGGVAMSAAIYQRDAYSFWAPLDQKFLDVMTLFCRSHGVRYISPFWSGLFFAQIDYSPAAAKLSYQETVILTNPLQTQSILADRFSPIGLYYQKLIRSQN